MKTIQRTAIREQVYNRILKVIVTGGVMPGDRIKDTELAAQLDVSRTPVRETLIRLEGEGFLENQVGRGFRVRPLELREVNELYPILWTLESLAVASGPPDPPTLEKMSRLNEEIARGADDPIRLIELDTALHNALVSGCKNERLTSMVGHLKTVLRRYEYKYMRHAALVAESVGDHERLIGFIRAGDVASASDLLKKHWQRSLETITTEIEAENGNETA